MLVVIEVLQINRIVVKSTQEKIVAQQTKMKDAQQWVLSTSMQDVVYKESTNELISIKGVEVSKLSVSDLCSFCVAHNITGYKNKRQSHTILFIVLHAQAMVVENTMCPLLLASDDDNNTSFGIDLSNGSNYTARNSSMNADTDSDEESVVAEKNKNQMQEEEEQFISLINNKKSITHEKRKSKRSKGTTPASITKIGTYYRFINVYFDDIHCSNVAKLGSAPSISKLDSRQFLHKMFMIVSWKQTLMSTTRTTIGLHLAINTLMMWESHKMLLKGF